MAVGGTRSASTDRCGEWERGGDCGFNSWWFHVVVAAIWAITSLPLIFKAIGRLMQMPTGATTWCLILTAMSMVCCFLDNTLYLLSTPSGGYSLHMLTFLGSILLVFALCLFAHLWCNVASALHAGAQGTLPVRSLQVIRHGYSAIAVLHVPFAALKAIADYKEELGLGKIRRDEIAFIWTLWSFVSACCALTLFSVIMAKVALRLRGLPNSQGFCFVTWVNLGEQLVYNVCLLVLAVLYYWGNSFNDHGSVQAAFFAVYFLIYWVMHAQVLAFFSVAQQSDPIYSKQNDVVGTSDVASTAINNSRIHSKPSVEEISFSWEGGSGINSIINELNSIKAQTGESRDLDTTADPPPAQAQSHSSDPGAAHDVEEAFFREVEEDEPNGTPFFNVSGPVLGAETSVPREVEEDEPNGTPFFNVSGPVLGAETAVPSSGTESSGQEALSANAAASYHYNSGEDVAGVLAPGETVDAGGRLVTLALSGKTKL